MKKLLVVVDMQNDFVTGALGTKEACSIVPRVATKISDEIEAGTDVIFTKDTHGENYLSTQEGRNLPIMHCIKGTDGWELIPELYNYSVTHKVIEKPVFGSRVLIQEVLNGHYTNVELIGLCTDICVISNAMIIKSADPEIVVSVDSSCCAGVTPESHENALNAMRMCQINIY